MPRRALALRMFMPENSTVALPLMILLLIFWGSWPACHKMGGTGTLEFGLTSVLAQYAICVAACLSLGLLSNEDARHFDGATLPQILRTELSEKPVAVLMMMCGGLITNLGDFVMAWAVEKIGIAVACPVGYGIALVLGTTANYAVETRADPALLFPGLVCCLLGIWADSASQSMKKRTLNREECPSSSGSSPEVFGAGADEPTCQGQSKSQDAPLHNDSRFKLWKDHIVVLALPIAGGICSGSWSPVSTVAATWGELHPYAQVFVYLTTQLLTIVPVVTAYAAVQEPSVVQNTGYKAPCAVLAVYAKRMRTMPRRCLCWNVLAGVMIGAGRFIFFVASPVVSRAVSFVFGSASSLTCILYGVFVFGEYAGSLFAQKALIASAALLFTVAITLMFLAST